MKKYIKLLSLILVCTSASVSLLASCENPNIGDSATTPGDTTLSEITTPPSESSQIKDTSDITPENTSFTMTQTSTVSEKDYESKIKYKYFLSKTEKKYIIPGLEQNTIPQGVAYSSSNDRIYITSYSNASNTPSVIFALNSEGTLVAEYILKNSDGTPFTGHVGGIAVTEQYIYISVGANGNGAYCVAEIKLSDLEKYGSHEITLNKKVSLPSGVSFLSYSDGILWAGNFYHPSANYNLGTVFNFTTTVDSIKYGGYAAAYKTDSNGRLIEDTSLGYAKPFYVLAIPNKVQGLAYSNGKIYLSTSYGRRNDSYIYAYDVSLTDTGKKITADSQTYNFDTLRLENLSDTILAIPMSEALTVTKDGNILVLFESGAMKYSDGYYRTDSIWKLNIN